MNQSPEPTAAPREGAAPTFTDAPVDLANEVFTWVMNEIEGGQWRLTFDAMTQGEQAAFFISLADAFSDTTEE